jgi:hypothetical protein
MSYELHRQINNYFFIFPVDKIAAQMYGNKLEIENPQGRHPCARPRLSFNLERSKEEKKWR